MCLKSTSIRELYAVKMIETEELISYRLCNSECFCLLCMVRPGFYLAEDIIVYESVFSENARKLSRLYFFFMVLTRKTVRKSLINFVFFCFY